MSLKGITELHNLNILRRLNSIKLPPIVDRNSVVFTGCVGEDIFHTCPYRNWGSPSLLYNGYRNFPVGEAAVVWRWPPTPFGAEVKEVNYTSTPSPDFHGLFLDKLYFLGLAVVSFP